jgi:hypothetical protein
MGLPKQPSRALQAARRVISHRTEPERSKITKAIGHRPGAAMTTWRETFTTFIQAPLRAT